MKYIKFFNEIRNSDVTLVGGKNASLGEMYQQLVPLGIHVPNGFAITAEAYFYLLKDGGIEKQIEELLSDVDTIDLGVLQDKTKKIRELIFSTPLPSDLRDEIISAYAKLGLEYDSQVIDVAVRSSATAEDLPDASFAGQQDTFLNVQGLSSLIHHIKLCFASLFTSRAVSYRQSRGFNHFEVGLSVCIQKMVRSDKASSGVMFTIDTESGFDKTVLITSAWGLGENVVGGMVNPDEFYVFKETLKEDKKPIIKRSLGNKDIKMIYANKTSGKTTININTTANEKNSFSINDEEILTLAKQAVMIEEHYSRMANRYQPMDIEWAKDGLDEKLYIVQARPETVQSQKKGFVEQRYSLEKTANKILTKGISIGSKIGSGRVRVIENLEGICEFKEGEVLVTDITDPDWEPVMKIASAVITNRGGKTCHAAIVAREIGVPAIVGCHNATEALKSDIEVTCDCARGDEGFVYEGNIPFTTETLDLSTQEETKTKIYLNVGNPSRAFSFSQIPNDGVGLARMEFIINNYIKVHPLALEALYLGKEVEPKEEIENIISGYSDPKDFFIKNIAEGVGMIASAFYPKPVIVRTSDFKSNEYKKMIGGAKFEPIEENPMIGYRGASRYYSEAYKNAFIWECEALKYVRETMGLTNVKLMLPFVRTPQEGRKVLNIMREQGLIQGENGLEIYVMCELPVNVILADEFLKDFDGFSIGSNDLTQLTLGVDRDSDLVSSIFDERNPAMKAQFKNAIDACKRAGKYVGICGQAPSDYPEVAEYLVELGIDSISLNPDSVMKVKKRVLEIEGKLG
ncbi:pyruvate, water dikinase [Sulfurovum sp. bin170]|uniref:pyruvate, water dikinase n=1 Tax=Sulfurovum sp. bin170 TaxID=2695268 RepID=UPI0013DF1577|nr:pyruvate, water dikinase [Sulfurovum sp. bin170]